MSEITVVGETAAERRVFLRDLLLTGVYQITFTKVNGESRTMPCTLQPELLPRLIVEGVKKDIPEEYLEEMDGILLNLLRIPFHVSLILQYSV